MRKFLLFLFALLFYAGSSWAQVSAYSFASTAGTYTEITGGTVLGNTTSDDQRFVDPAVPLGGTVTTGVGFPIGFNFTFGGVVFDRLAINNNGWISLGQSALTPAVNIASTSSYVPLSSTTTITPDNLVSRIAGVGFDQQGQTGGELRIQTIGTTPNMECVIQWKGYRGYGLTGDNLNYQIRLLETSNKVVIVFGTMTKGSTSGTVQVGLRGAPSLTATNYTDRMTTTNWAATTAGTSNSSTCTLSTTVFPASGLTFTFTSPTPCIAPTNQPTNLVLTPGSTTIDGSFTAAAGSDSYLVLRSTNPSPTATPVDGTPYPAGTVLGNDTAVYAGPNTTFSSTGLHLSTQYYFFVYSMNSICAGGPKYLVAQPLTGGASTCILAPVSSAGTLITTTGFTANWAASTGATSYLLEVATTSTFTPGTFVTGYPQNVGNIYTWPVTGLNSASTYYYRVAALTGSCTSPYSGTQTVNTLCNAVTVFPYTMSFGASLTDCWAASEGVTGAIVHWANTTADVTHGASAPQSGTHFAYLNVYNASTTYNPYYLTTLDFTLGATTRQVRYYYWLGDNNTVTPLTLQISTNGGGTWNDLYAHPSPTYNTWTLNTVILTAYVNQTVKFRFKSVSNYGGSFCNQGIDEFVIENAPSCAPPSALTATSITMSGADMGWTSDATEWEYQVGLTGFTPAATGTATTLNPTHISGLTANTSYDFYVRSKCGALFSNWSGPKTFRTLCGATTIPFVENFDSYTPPAIGCGTIIDVNGDGIKWASSAGTAYNDPNKLHIGYSAAGVTQDDWYITQGITLTGGQSYDVKFYYKGGSSSYLESLEVKWGAAPTAAGMTSPAIFSDLSFYKAAYTLGVGSFVPSTSGTYYVGWHCISIGDQLSIDVDQITIDVTPACPPPTALTAINITGSAADIGWTSNATAWEYQVGLTGFTPSATGIATTTNPTHISGLASNTAYDFYVRTNCSGAFSDWSGPHTFSTLCSAVSTFPYTQSFAATFTDCWFASEETTGASIHWATTTGDGTYGVIGPQAGTHFAFLNVYDATTGYNPYYLTTLDFALGATPRQVKYYYWLGTSGYQTSPDPLTLQVSTDNGLNWTDLYAHNSTNSVFSTTNALTGWTLNTVLLSNYINQTVKFRFKSMSNYGSGFCDQGLDEFVVENAPPMGVLQGHVFDAGAEEPLFGATVSFGTFSTTSDGSGFYQFPYVPVGTYDVTCSKAGFQPITVTGLAVTVNHTTVHDFNMLYQLDPPEGLQAEVQSQYNVHLTWRAPGSQPDQWIHWDNGAYGNALGLTNPATWFVAQRFPVSDIAAFGGMHLKKIKFWPYDVRDTYTLKVWTGANAATEVASQLVLSPVIDAWNEITLTIPIVIDGTKELWIGYEIVQTTTSNWPAGMDTGPAIAGKGDWINYSGSWAEVAGFGFNNNWLLQGWVQNSAASGPLTQLVPDSKLAVMPVNTNGDLKLSSVNGGNQIDQIAYLGASLPAALNMQENNFRPEITAPDTPLSTWPVSGYNVYRNGTKINTALVPTLYYTNVGVAPGVHSYTVKAVYAMGESPNAAGPVEVTIYSCDVPTTLQVPNATLSTTTAKATWVASVNTPTPHWVIEYGLKGFIHGTGIVANVNLTPEYTMTPLLPGTEYDFYVRTLCNQGDSSAWIKKTFRTHYFACTQGSVAELEICGDTTNNGCNLVVPTFEPISCGVTICGTSWFNGAYRDTDWFTFTLAETKDVTLTATAEFAFLFGFIDSPCPAVAFKASNTGNAGATASVTLQLAAGTYYAFMAPQFVGHIVCDSINRYLLTMTCNTCLTPTALTAIGMTTTSAILEWTSTASLFNIEWGPAGFQKGQGTTVNNVTNPHTLSNLVGSTSYDYYVQANCGNTLSGWAGPYTFSTLCDVAPAPWAEGFEGSAFFPTCWSGSTVAPVWIRSIACGGYGTSTASAKANFYSISSTTPFDLISLEFNASALHLPLLKFDYAYMTYVGELDEMDVYYSTDAGVTFTLLLAMPGGYDGILNTCGGTGSSSAFTPTANQWATQSLALPAGTNMVKFQGISAWGNNLYLDNVRVEATPIPEFLNVQGTVTTTECYNATQTITVGGVAAPFIEEATGSVNFVAGHNIKFMPSTWIKNGAYMRAHITTTGTYCGDAAKTMVTKTVEVADAVPAMEPGSFFKVYPNPTNDKFYLEMDPTYLDSQVQVQIFGMVGGLIRKEELTGNNRYEFSLGGKPAGIYFIRVLVGDRLETKKIIKQ